MPVGIGHNGIHRKRPQDSGRWYFPLSWLIHLLWPIHGHEFQVDILRHDIEDPRRPLACSGDLAIYVVNGGDGRRRTSEDEGRGAMALGMYLDQRGAKAPPLMTLSQRSKSFGSGGFVLLDDDGASKTEKIVADRRD